MVTDPRHILEHPEDLRAVNPDDQLCPSSGRQLRIDSWRPALTGLTQSDDFLERLRAHTSVNGTLRRTWVMSVSDDVERLAASTIWGFGNYVWRGRKFLREQIAPENHATIREIANAARRSPEHGFLSLFENGSPRVPFLGIAYGTKFLYFTARRSGGPWSLIYDKRVHIGLKRLHEHSTRLNPPRIFTRPNALSVDDYSAYVKFALSLDAERPDRVEYLLFQLGK